MRNSPTLVNDIPSLRIFEDELARYESTGSLLHLAHAQRALEEAHHELVALSRRRWRDDLTQRLGNDVPGFSERN